MSSIAARLAQRLDTVRRPGDFFVSGTSELPTPRLEVDGVGPIALPLLPMQAQQLVAVAERAPYGRGMDTLVDTQVRRTWQIGADRVRTEGKHWARTLDGIVHRAAEGLGVAEPIAAELYKLLVYDQGSFFVSHRDTEKVPGMFATLVVALPSTSTGGELIVRHKSREVRLDLRCEDPSEAAFAAFYADCVHEVLPVTSGCRLALVYNLLRRGKGAVPEPPSYDDEQARVAALLQAWTSGTSNDAAPTKLIYPLEHAYTSAELGFDTLKGVDAAVAGVLAAAARQSGCDLHLALLTIEESGTAEHGGGYGRYSDDDDFEADEVLDRNVSLSGWRRPDGSRPGLGELPIEDEELAPPDALEDLDPDEEEFREATGNEGASFDRIYRRAALVLWPREQFLAVLNQAGPPVTLPFLSDLTERWAASDEDRHCALWHQAHELSGHIISSWPRQREYDPEDRPSRAARMLTLSTRLEDTECLAAFLGHIAEYGTYAESDVNAILGALALFAPAENAAFVERLIAGTATSSLGTCGRLLSRAAAVRHKAQCADLAGAAGVLVKALPGDPSHPAPREIWQRDSRVQPGFIVDLFTAVACIDEALAERTADHVLAWPETYDFDRVLVPALRDLVGSSEIKDSGAVQRLRIACIEYLKARVAQPLQAPTDWSRASALGCHCRHCTELSLFLADPDQKTWTLRAVEFERQHVGTTIGKARCDLDVRTERRGRPYSLVCVKNQATHERHVKQRDKDLADLERLGE
jgi:predicted 2-oxoglutarate/Fe(II)-dependent dioxygenase YbiX